VGFFSSLLDVPLHESVGVLLERRIVAYAPYGLGRVGRAMLRGAAGHRAGLLPGFDAGVIAEPPHSRLPRGAPEPVVDRLQRAHEEGARRDGARAERPHGEAPPPDIRLGERADGGAREAASPVRVHVGSDLVASEPIDLVLLDPVEDHLVPERHAVRGTVDGALATNLAKVLHA